MTGTLPPRRTTSRLEPLHIDWFTVGGNELLPAWAEPGRASPGVVPMASFVNDAGQVCEVMAAEDGTLRCVLLDPYSGLAAADLATFPEVVPFTY